MTPGAPFWAFDACATRDASSVGVRRSRDREEPKEGATRAITSTRPRKRWTRPQSGDDEGGARRRRGASGVLLESPRWIEGRGDTSRRAVAEEAAQCAQPRMRA